MIEEWKKVYGFEDTYLVNEKGIVLAVDKIVNAAYGSKQLRKQHFMKIHTNNKGYLYFSPYTKRKYFIHKCIYEAFVGPIPEGYDLHHINHNHQDNRLENLCLIDKRTHITMHLNEHFEKFRKLSVKARSKPIIQYTLDGKFIREWESQAEASRQCGIYFGSISNCCLGRSKTAGGFIWRFKEG